MQPNPPPAVKFAVFVLIAITVIQVIVAIARFDVCVFFAAIVGNLLLAYGLYHGAKVAYILTMLFGVVMPLALPANGAAVLTLNSFVFVPVILETRYFWPERERPSDPHWSH